MLNGKKELVDKFLKWLETRIFYLPFENPNLSPTFTGTDGKPLLKGFQPIDAGLRYGLFGTWEYVFPKENLNEVLTTLNFHKKVKAENNKGELKMKARLKTIQLALGLEKIPKFNKDKEILLPQDLKEHIRIIPLGVRYDTIGEVEGVFYERL